MLTRTCRVDHVSVWLHLALLQAVFFFDSRNYLQRDGALRLGLDSKGKVLHVSFDLICVFSCRRAALSQSLNWI